MRQVSAHLFAETASEKCDGKGGVGDDDDDEDDDDDDGGERATHSSPTFSKFFSGLRPT